MFFEFDLQPKHKNAYYSEWPTVAPARNIFVQIQSSAFAGGNNEDQGA